MLVYLDANCFNRPFDDQAQDRVRRETEAVLGVLQRVLSGEDELAWSSALSFELGAHPEPDIREQLTSWAERSRVSVPSSDAVRERTDEFVAGGMRALDAAHLAFAETANCAVLLTCDDRFLRRAQQVCSIRVLNPVEYLSEITRGSADD